MNCRVPVFTYNYRALRRERNSNTENDLSKLNIFKCYFCKREVKEVVIYREKSSNQRERLNKIVFPSMIGSRMQYIVRVVNQIVTREIRKRFTRILSKFKISREKNAEEVVLNFTSGLFDYLLKS